MYFRCKFSYPCKEKLILNDALITHSERNEELNILILGILAL